MTQSLLYIVAERSTWQDILHMKTKLDLIKQSYNSLIDSCNQMTASSTSGQLEVDDIVTVASNEAVEPKPDVTILSPAAPRLSFPSLDEWSTLSRTEHQRSFKQWEVEYLSAVEQDILPHVSHYISSLPPGSEQTTKAVSVIRTLFMASKVSSRPVYLDSDQVVDIT